METPERPEKTSLDCTLSHHTLSRTQNPGEFCSNCKHHVCTKYTHDKCSEDRSEELRAALRDLKIRIQAEDRQIEALQLKLKSSRKRVVDQSLLETCRLDLQSWTVAIHNKNKEIKELNCIVQGKQDIEKLMEKLIAQKNNKLQECKYRKSRQSFDPEIRSELKDSMAQKTCKCFIF